MGGLSLLAAVRYPVVSLFEPGSKTPVFCTPLMRYREFSCAHTAPSIGISTPTGIGPLHIGRIANNTWGNAEFYGCTFIDKLLTAQQRADARQYYAEKRGVAIIAPTITGGAVYFVETYGEQSLFDLSDELDPIINETYPEIMENY